MITLERTLDYELVRQIMTHPRLYDHLVDDGAPAAELFYPAEHPGIFHLLAREGDEVLGLYITNRINAATWEVHHALLPCAWGDRALAVGRAYEAWMWENTGAQTLLGFTPSCNRLALRYARRLGMTVRGQIPQAWRRGGVLHDLIVLAKHRELKTWEQH